MNDQMAKLREFRLRKPSRPYAVILRGGKRIVVRDLFQVAVEHSLKYASAHDEEHASYTAMPTDLERVEDATGEPSQN